MNIEINQETLVALYGNSNSEGRKVLRDQLGERFSEILPVTERVKTFDDALEELGQDHEAVKSYKDIEWKLGEGQEDITAYLKLRVITEALNEGWHPEFTEDEYRYYPWYQLFTQAEIDDMSEERKKEIGLVLWGGSAFIGSSAGLACANSRNAFSFSSSHYGARLAFKTPELAIYAAKQFIEIYADFCFRPKQNKEKVG